MTGRTGSTWRASGADRAVDRLDPDHDVGDAGRLASAVDLDGPGSGAGESPIRRPTVGGWQQRAHQSEPDEHFADVVAAQYAEESLGRPLKPFTMVSPRAQRAVANRPAARPTRGNGRSIDQDRKPTNPVSAQLSPPQFITVRDTNLSDPSMPFGFSSTVGPFDRICVHASRFTSTTAGQSRDRARPMVSCGPRSSVLRRQRRGHR